jgi:uncharacterized protein (DUF362 family)/NAD-dependent dihydropyrimidine dehydrogenase PreA subunit
MVTSMYSRLSYDDEAGVTAAIEDGMVGCGRIRPGDRVAIKANVLGPFPASQAATSHPAVVGATARVMADLGARVVVYEDCYSDLGPRISGIEEAMACIGIRYVALAKREYRRISGASRDYMYAVDILECDHLVSVPKMKNHLLTTFSGAVKNMYGCLLARQRKEFHSIVASDDFADLLLEVYAIRLPTLVVMDGIVAMDGMGPSAGGQVGLGVLLVGDDGLSIDYHSVELLGYNPHMIATTCRSMSSRAPSELRVIGERPDERKRFRRLPTLSSTGRSRFIQILAGSISVDPEKCTRCGTCESHCPFNAIRSDGLPRVDPEKCRLCSCCVELCPSSAILPRGLRK